MENPRLEKENRKHIINFFRLKKELNYNAIKYIRKLFRIETETTGIKDRIPGDIKNLFEHEVEEENFYESVRVSTFRNNYYIEYKINCYRNITL